MIGSWVPGQMNVTGRMIHRRAGGNPEHTDPFTAIFAVILCSMWTGLSWLIAFLAFIGDGEGPYRVTVIILSVISGLLSFIPLCLIIGYCLFGSKDN